ncbi:MAG: zinc-ribbon domain-containing protein [Archangiaceae bacterium]|nr:zinc-ribbon domain-containing protein [Archangiaceae bacterium]
MDVSCPRCKTEYEFDDARVPDSGVTVKCTSCNHVFRVRKKSAPSASHAAPPAPAPAPAPVQAPAPPPARVGDETIPARSPLMAQAPTREWKVRQPSGNIFSFKELTTLQKWIVERKVSRDDEISLTGEAWKRLGNIAELASFFQIVDDAKKVHELEALQQLKDAPPEPPPPPPPPPREEPPPRKPEPRPPPPPSEAPGNSKLLETLREPGFTSLPPKPPPDERPVYKPPPLPVNQRRDVQPEEETQRPNRKSGGAGMVLGLMLVFAGLGGAAGYYFLVMAPEQRRAQEAADIEARAKAEAAAKLKAEEDAKVIEKAQAEAKAAEEAKKKEDEEKARAAAAVVPDAGAAVAVVGKKEGESPVAGRDGGTPKRNADYWISQGDRLRDKERAEAALDAYGKALDITPDNVEALTGRGLCLLDMAKPLQAEPVLEQAVKLNPRYAPAIMGLAESYRFQGKKDAAIATYQRYLDSFPNGPEANVARSNIERLK